MQNRFEIIAVFPQHRCWGVFKSTRGSYGKALNAVRLLLFNDLLAEFLV